MTDGAKGAAENPQDISFEDACKELEQIVSSLESGRGGLEDALTQFERGVALVRLCRQRLDGAVRKIALLKGLDEAGEPQTEDVGDSELTKSPESAGRQVKIGTPQFPAGLGSQSDESLASGESTSEDAGLKKRARTTPRPTARPGDNSPRTPDFFDSPPF